MSSPKISAQIESEKQAAAQAALRYVRNGMLLGLGSGSTAGYFLSVLAERVRCQALKVNAVASSLKTAARAKELGIPIYEPRRGVRVDLTIDGSDEIAPDLNLLKGAGGALLREKIVACASRHFLVIADSSKVVPQLGRRPVPLEVTPFAMPWVMDRIAELGGNPVWRMETSKPDRPYLTDQQNYIVDCDFGLIADAQTLAARLDGISGVLEHGLFLGLARAALIGQGQQIMVLRSRRPPVPLSQSDLTLD